MIKFLKRIWSDVQQGENLDVYITIVVALVVSSLNLLNYATPDTLPALTLAVLALLSISGLVSRHRSEDLAQKISPSIANVFLHEFPESLKTDIESASEIWLFGLTLSSFIDSDTYALLEKRIQKGLTLRILLLNPDQDDAVNLAVMRSYRNSISRIQGVIRELLQDFCRLQKSSPKKVSIRTVNCLIGHRLIAINPDSPSGIFYIANYPFQVPGSSRPKYVIHAKDGEWYQFFRDEAELLWKSGQEWTCNNIQQS